jgi:CheY-like chemotaxis protein
MPQKILVIENSQEYRDLLKRVVEGLGYEAMIAEQATTAWKMMQSSPPDLVLLDVKMPTVHGDAFLKYARERGCTAPFIAVSGYLTPRVVERLKRGGINHVISKPFKIQRIASEIHKAMETAGG